ncbi:MAG TPA: NUDIX domain-containing protein [Candidatus Poseidoniales archaeon]|jgi:8-oxo-dGTP pyrophosphatase MutT (NUDIX family)|nr:MAG: hypothetical protein CXT69_02680 [Euryarchaeota archaeon]HIG03951.1 NUDIX domain-containing protein [Candidatus Poseidoniales archaeon]HIK78626.1 NUDIX domain-containing protein [Candidatus Poseidoniales archaeon]
MTEPEFVLAWVTLADEAVTPEGEGGRFLLVRNKTRGWELPGGTRESDETPMQTLFRELFEETGVSGRFICWNKKFYPKGWVGWVIAEELFGKKLTNDDNKDWTQNSQNTPDTEPESWKVYDSGVVEAKWHTESPEMYTWDASEITVLAKWAAEWTPLE